ncbi:adenylate kinase 4 [Anaeramoeba flamelloides]|uniref:Adenylate kinase n=1 Tax=Anaeramoeba flamelloides TaxID=1746091 RepID=A0AAV7YDT3_9EUKA|nr:adenylate kinase [Anaeramoeba flamelloides]KAJ6236171.1 adenylate kinase 4 [Anaeramoeba flamelloides]|eukprot:Anaeramoba_flamelloidesa86335_400.p1 GENE.a86335_400~~a86335_400.p1  ORF type:complete len:227 (-),score=48.52 a86335_400:284-964(-)
MGESLFLTFIGPPACGKGTQSELLQKHYGIGHLSTGDMLREAIRQQTPLGKKVDGIISKGQFVSNEIVRDLINENLDQPANAQGVVFDGYPRTLEQAKTLDELLGKRGKELTIALELSISYAELVDRVTGRLIHRASGRVYHKTFHPPKVPMTDDITGEPLVQRKDDTIETLNERLKKYKETGTPILEYYKSKGKLVTINASLGRDYTYSMIQKTLTRLNFHKKLN